MALSAAPRPYRRRPSGETIDAADLFASGVYRGKRYTAADLDEMARNFTRLRLLIDPPLVLGHEAEQDRLAEYLERTDLPAAGWVDRVWVDKYLVGGRVEGTLRGRLVGLAKKVADEIRSGRYRKVSAEIYDNYRDDFGHAHGLALRRVGLLGAEVPQVKRIGDLPAPRPAFEVDQYSERRRCRLRPAGGGRATASGTHICFAEAAPMTRDELAAELSAAMPGIQRATLEAMPDDALADLSKNLPKPQPQAGQPAPGVTAMADPATMSREDLIAALTGAGEDPASLEGMSDDDLKEKYVELGLDDESEPAGTVEGEGGTAQTMGDPATMTRDELIAELVALGEDPATLEGMSDDDLRAKYMAAVNPAGATATTAAPAPAAAMSDATRSGLMQYAEQTIRHTLANTLRHNARLKKERVQKFCEQLVKDGKILPRDVPFYTWSLLKASDRQPVHTYSEGGRQVKGTELDKVMSQLSGYQPVMRFSEKVAATPKTSANREMQAVRRFAETQASSLRAAGLTSEQYVSNFSEARKKNPALTAKEYGVPDEYYAA